MTAIDHPTTKLPICPAWCSVDHERQQREADVLHPESADDREPWHSRTLAEGVNTASHGPIYDVVLEQNSDGIAHLWAHLETNNLSADQAEVFGLALVRAAHMLRASADPSDEVLLTHYWNGKAWVQFSRTVLEPTPAERELSTEGKETA